MITGDEAVYPDSRLSPKHQAAVEFVTDVLRRHDPENLVSSGAPPDEYLPEAKRIAPRMFRDAETREDLADLIWAVFVVMFKPRWVRRYRDKLELATDEIWAYLTEHRQQRLLQERERGPS